MTSMNMSVLPAGPPEQNYQVAKSESPPLNEGVYNPFRDSLEKAMAAEEQRSAIGSSTARDKTETVKAKTSDQNTEAPAVLSGEESVKEEALKKKERTSPLKSESIGKEKTGETQQIQKKVKTETEREVLNEDAALNLLQSGERKQLTVKKREILSRDRRTEAAKKDKAAPTGNDLSQRGDIQGRTASFPGQTESLEKSGEARKKSEKSDDVEQSVVIPFPSVGETGQRVSENAMQNITAQDGNARQVVKGPVSGRKAGKEEPVLTVVDTRSKRAENRESAQAVTKTAMVTESVDPTNRESQAIVLGEQNGPSAGEDIKTFESRFNESREVMLARELRESGNDQIVKKASFILKDNNQGEIKLILKPEALGRVKIHLNMNENNLVGKIIVENNRVGQIFENNLSNLSKAFEEAGISSSSLEVSVGDGNSRKDGGDQTFQKDQPFYSEKLKALDHAVPTLERAASGQGSQLVNLVV